MPKPTTLVVGAGAGGLTAALYLQRAGHDVVVLEAQEHVGGCASAFDARGYRFLSGATTLVGLEPDMPLGVVLGELGITLGDVQVPDRNVTVHAEGPSVTLTRDPEHNRAALAARFGEDFARFWATSASLGRRGWALVTQLPNLPPRGFFDLAALAGSGAAWSLVPSLLKSTARALDTAGDIGAEARTVLDELLVVSTQARAAQTPWLFGALGIEYLGRPMALLPGGLATLLETMAAVFTSRGGTLLTKTRVTGLRSSGRGYVAQTPGGDFEAERAVLNLTHWDAAKLVEPKLGARFAAEVKKHPDAWATVTLYLGVEDNFDAATAPYHQVCLPKPLPSTAAHSLFITLSRPGDTRAAPAGHRTLTVSCHALAADWLALGPEAARERKAAAQAELLAAVKSVFPALNVYVTVSASPGSWQGFTGRSAGRVGGLPFDYRTLLAGYPSGRTGHANLLRVGDTTFPGQSVMACAWGARRAVATDSRGTRPGPLSLAA